jgi:hypothetical protein
MTEKLVMCVEHPIIRRPKTRSNAGIKSRRTRILFDIDYLPGHLEAQIDAFVAHYSHQLYHDSLGNLTPADVYSGRGQTILMAREKIKRKRFDKRSLLNRKSTAKHQQPDELDTLLAQAATSPNLADGGQFLRALGGDNIRNPQFSGPAVQ